MDDEEDICAVIKDQLEQHMNQCTVVCDGMQGLDSIKTGVYDLIFLDLKMPVMTGFDILRMLAYGGQLAGRRVVVMTAYPLTINEKEQMKSAGVIEVLTKPFAPESIEKLLLQVKSEPRITKIAQ